MECTVHHHAGGGHFGLLSSASSFSDNYSCRNRNPASSPAFKASAEKTGVLTLDETAKANITRRPDDLKDK